MKDTQLVPSTALPLTGVSGRDSFQALGPSLMCVRAPPLALGLAPLLWNTASVFCFSI